MSCPSSSGIASRVESRLEPYLTELKADLRREFRAADARQQKQLDRVEAKLDRLLELFEPRVIDKPAEMTGARSIGKAKVMP